MIRIRRSPVRLDDGVAWDPACGSIDTAKLEDLDAIINLAGEPIASPWTAHRRRQIIVSRVDATALLAAAVGALRQPPRVLVNASATGIYGDRGSEVLTEASPRGSGFLAEVTDRWEQSALTVRSHSVRVVCLRTGVVLSPDGGALSKLLPLFRLGLGGRVGSGRQWMSWISRTDAVAIIHHVLQHESIKGPVNAVSPNPVSNAEFTATLGRVLRRPSHLPVPAAVLLLVFGEMARETMLASQRVRPAKLMAGNFPFEHAYLGDALRAELDSR